MQVIRTRYFGPADTKAAKIQAKAEAGLLYVSYDSSLNDNENHRAACEALVRKLKWHEPRGRYAPMVGGMFANDYYWVSTDNTLCEVKP